MIEDEGLGSKRDLLQKVKELVRRELEHLIIINSHSLELQSLANETKLNTSNTNSPDKTHNHLQSQTNDILVRSAIERLKQLYPNEPIDEGHSGNDYEEEQMLGEVVEHVIQSYEMLQEENKLLLKERQYFYDKDIKSIVKENEDLVNENQRLLEQLKQLKSIDHQRVRELEKQITEKSHKD